MKKMLSTLAMFATFVACCDEMSVTLKDLEYYEVKRSIQPYVLLHDTACNIRTTLEKIIAMIPAQDLSDSLHSVYQRINMGYISVPLYTAKEAVQSAYSSLVTYLSSMLENAEIEKLKESLLQYHRSIDNGGFVIVCDKETTESDEQLSDQA